MASVQISKFNDSINVLKKMLQGSAGGWPDFQTDDLEIAVDLPGIDPTEICLRLVGGVLTISPKKQGVDITSNPDSFQVVAVNSKMEVALRLAEQLAGTHSPVIIYGEHGTGKNLFAGVIHNLSARREFPVVTLSCGALRGNSVRLQIEECLNAAGCGTLFLDSVHDLLPSVQEELYMFLSQQEQARIISATDTDLDKEVALKRFSDDLLRVIRGGYIELPPLRERREDIEPLAAHYVALYCQERGIGSKVLSPDLSQLLLEYHWPGNVRELVNTLEQLILTAQHRQTLFPKDLPDHIRIETIQASSASKQGL